MKQIDKIIEAIALTLPQGIGVNQSIAIVGLSGGTQSTANLDSNNTASQPIIPTSFQH